MDGLVMIAGYVCMQACKTDAMAGKAEPIMVLGLMNHDSLSCMCSK